MPDSFGVIYSLAGMGQERAQRLRIELAARRY